MNNSTLDSLQDVIDLPKYLPCISILMPFEPKMGLKKELDFKLKTTIDKVEKEINATYPSEKSKPILKKLHNCLNNINYLTHKKSIAIFVSPMIEKVYYLDMPIEEKIVIDDSFEIRDLIYSKKEIHQYLLVVLSSKWTKIFLSDHNHFLRITSTVSDNIAAYQIDNSEKIANFSDEQKRKQILLDKFLRHTDNGLSLLLQAYNLPIFVMGTKKTIGHFKSISHNLKHIVDYVPGNYEETPESELQSIMTPYVNDWKLVLQRNLIRNIDDAMSHKKAVSGISQVWKAATLKRGRLLIVEKNYYYPADQSATPEIIFKHDDVVKNSFFIKDAVDDIIEKVLISGGDVEFVDEGLLKEYEKIALIEYY